MGLDKIFWPEAQKIIDAAIEKAYNGQRSIQWKKFWRVRKLML
jgi:isocitrate dehydrogenase